MNSKKIIDDAYNNYCKHFTGYDDIPKIDWFIQEIKTDSNFSKKWGLKIEERELGAQERLEWVKTNLPSIEVGGFVNNDEYSHKWVETLGNNIPTKLITLTYNNETIGIYE